MGNNANSNNTYKSINKPTIFNGNIESNKKLKCEIDINVKLTKQRTIKPIDPIVYNDNVENIKTNVDNIDNAIKKFN